jgi:hypothetical protein
MSKLVIKKRVSLEFLGEDYKDAFIVFRSIPLAEYEQISKQLPTTNKRFTQLQQLKDSGEVSDEEQAEYDELATIEATKNIESFKTIINFLKKYYLTSGFPSEDGNIEPLDSVEELDSMDKDAAMKCFDVLTGQSDDPKDGKPLTT